MNKTTPKSCTFIIQIGFLLLAVLGCIWATTELPEGPWRFLTIFGSMLPLHIFITYYMYETAKLRHELREATSKVIALQAEASLK